MKNNNNLSLGRKAKRTGIWAKTMTKWEISHSLKGAKKWQIVSFEGPGKGESRGIVDLIAIRRDHKYSKKPLKIGDLFEPRSTQKWKILKARQLQPFEALATSSCASFLCEHRKD